ncbi:GGDEF domain-containing protein [Bradyrhizobium sp. HKCCYLS1011]|uniref:GGDEF domain-containing protein n=1 Tax=Bradyrhizobium sp. HKCCYLS1011 TaxID=3420733 RepID=UPI003EB976FD
MLSVPTLWTAFIVNFLALGLIWAYVMRSYPNLEAARFWTGSALVAAAAAMLALLRVYFDAILPLLLGSAMIVFAICLEAMGVQRFYGRPVSWRNTALIVLLTSLAVTFFVYVYDSQSLRIMAYSIGQCVPVFLIARQLLDPQHGRVNPGARLAGVLAVMIMAMFVLRVVGTLTGLDFNITHSSNVQSVAVLFLIFLSMSLNFGFLLMAVDRLRNEVADLALLDDLTGVANRRHLMQRLTEECARSERSGRSFALLVIDLDGFKLINDSYGHAAGDACLQHFTLMAQTRLRPDDMLARTGGDEFCIVLPSSALREGEMIARRVLQVCRDDAEACAGSDVGIAVSIGVAEWTREVGLFPDRLIAHADHALYAAKKQGKNRYALYDGTPPLAPDEIGTSFSDRAAQGASMG